MGNTDKTLEYYNKQAFSFVSGTVDVKFFDFQNRFIAYLPESGTILDLGCGSGRDSKAFIGKGYEVTAVDGSEELCKIASDYIGIPVICSTFQEFETDKKFDGVWACASLLHLEYIDLKSVMKKISSYLKNNGCFYISFKYGSFSGERNGRFFTDMTEEKIREILKDIPSLTIDIEFITGDVREGRENEKWLNMFLIKKNV